MPGDTVSIKSPKSIQIPLKSAGGSNPSSGTKPLVNPMPVAQQVKVVNRLITFFETK